MSELFARAEFRSFLDGRKRQIENEIASEEKEYIMKFETEKYCEYLISKYSLDPLLLFIENKVLLEPKETKTRGRDIFGDSVRVPATEFTLVILFEGDPDYFFYKPNHRIIRRRKEGLIRGNELNITFTVSDYSRTSIDKEIKDVIEDIEFHVNSLNKDIKNFNNSIGIFIKPRIEKRNLLMMKSSIFLMESTILYLTVQH